MIINKKTILVGVIVGLSLFFISILTTIFITKKVLSTNNNNSNLKDNQIINEVDNKTDNTTNEKSDITIEDNLNIEENNTNQEETPKEENNNSTSNSIQNNTNQENTITNTSPKEENSNIPNEEVKSETPNQEETPKEEKKDIIETITQQLPSNYKLYIMPVDMNSTYANSIMPNDYIDFYFKGKDKTGTIFMYKFIENIKVLAILDANNQNVFENANETRIPAKMLFSLPNDIYDLFTKAKTIPNSELFFTPNTNTTDGIIVNEEAKNYILNY